MMKQEYENKSMKAIVFKDDLAQHLEKKWPFILFNDRNYYCKFYPNDLVVAEYNGENVSEYRLSENDFHLKIINTNYQNFHSLSPYMEYPSDFKQSSKEIKVLDI